MSVGRKSSVALEARFDSNLNAENLDAWMQRITEKPFFVGAPHNKDNAEWTRDLFQSWGYQAEIVEYQVLFPTPKIRVLEMVAPERYSAGLAEPVLDLNGQVVAINAAILPEFSGSNLGVPAGELRALLDRALER